MSSETKFTLFPEYASTGNRPASLPQSPRRFLLGAALAPALPLATPTEGGTL